MITAIDFRVLNAIQRKMRCRALDCIMPKVSMAGNFGMVWLLTAVLFLTSESYEDAGVKIICGLSAGVILGNLLLKNIFSRPRPFQTDKTKTLLIKAPQDYSFPSGHALSSAISTVILVHTNIIFGMLALALCLMILFSRMYLYVHYPSDIAGGIVLGVIKSQAVLRLNIQI